MAGFHRTGIGRKVRRLVGVSVRVAIKAGHTAAWQCRTAVLGLVKLLLRERSQQKAQSFQLLGVNDAVEQLVVIFDSIELALRDISEIRALIEVDRGRE